MCGICGIFNLNYKEISEPEQKIKTMMNLIKHRGPDENGYYIHENIILGHNRLSIIDIKSGQQPMKNGNNIITYNGEIYNYQDFQKEFDLKTNSDTEIILKMYEKHSSEMLSYFKGMFSFAIWNEKERELFCARDRFGIKPFYYTIKDNKFYFASEIKALLPFINVEVDEEGLKDYIVFQSVLGEKTLFKDVKELLPGHYIIIKNGNIRISKYWENIYNIDKDHTEKYFIEKLDYLLNKTIKLHTVGDVDISSYVSGGIDSGLVSSISSRIRNNFIGFTGKFSEYGNLFDESRYARTIAKNSDFPLLEIDITFNDFVENIKDVIYYLDYPIAGPGSFSQYMVSKEASKHRKVVLGGQGGDEIFGGYTRYLIAYFEQCIKAAIDGSLDNGNYVVTYQSIIPNLKHLNTYKSTLKDFWRKGLFDSMYKRYYRLIDRSLNFKNTINWHEFSDYDPIETFRDIFMDGKAGHQSYFDLMTNFDFQTLLPSLLQVEDRVSMAYGLESRVPLLDHEFTEVASSIPANIKFKNGELKRVLKLISKKYLPKEIYNREDKMGFPTPINNWMNSDFIKDIFSSMKPNKFIKKDVILNNLNDVNNFDRGLWGLFSLALWYDEFL